VRSARWARVRVEGCGREVCDEVLVEVSAAGGIGRWAAKGEIVSGKTPSAGSGYVGRWVPHAGPCDRGLMVRTGPESIMVSWSTGKRG
jgi:hypothetical protein